MFLSEQRKKKKKKRETERTEKTTVSKSEKMMYHSAAAHPRKQPRLLLILTFTALIFSRKITTKISASEDTASTGSVSAGDENTLTESPIMNTTLQNITGILASRYIEDDSHSSQQTGETDREAFFWNSFDFSTHTKQPSSPSTAKPPLLEIEFYSPYHGMQLTTHPSPISYFGGLIFSFFLFFFLFSFFRSFFLFFFHYFNIYFWVVGWEGGGRIQPDHRCLSQLHFEVGVDFIY